MFTASSIARSGSRRSRLVIVVIIRLVVDFVGRVVIITVAVAVIARNGARRFVNLEATTATEIGITMPQSSQSVIIIIISTIEMIVVSIHHYF